MEAAQGRRRGSRRREREGRGERERGDVSHVPRSNANDVQSVSTLEALRDGHRAVM